MGEPREITCYDLCCGAGALSQGFRQAGATILGGIDTDPQALATATMNCPAGIWEKKAIEDLALHLRTCNGHPIWQANTLLAGLPCQGFSRAGKRDPEDPRNQLYRFLVKVVATTEPDHVVFENVVGMTTTKTRSILDSLIDALSRLGYDVSTRILDAVDFGVPQYRKRLVLIAVREGLADWVFECLRPSGPELTVRDAFCGLPGNRQVRRLSHVFMNHGAAVTEKLRTIKPGGPLSYRRLVWGTPAGTLVCGHRALPVHPRQPRAISVREAARLQGFADSFCLEGSVSSQIEQVANAVPPPLAKAVGSALKRYKKHAERIHGSVFRRLVGWDTPSLRRRFSRTFHRSMTRSYPWRRLRSPYGILLTEMLLQRTNADLAATIWRDVMKLCPSPRSAAKVDLRSLTALTRRIGIRSRARTIKNLGGTIERRHRGQVPGSLDDLMRLSGVGLYIASAVRTLCFGEQDFPVDTNAFRFVSRYFGIALTRTKSEGRQLREFLSPLMPKSNGRQYIYGFLDFAAQTCRPRKPLCEECSLRRDCAYSGSRS